MTSDGLGEMFEGDAADTCGRKIPQVSMGERIPLMSMGGKIPLACADPGAMTHIGASGIFLIDDQY